MALINVPTINNLDAATPDLFNSRFAVIANEINGNLDATNLAAGGVTASRLATDSVTTGKIAAAAVTPPKWTNPYKFSVYRSAAYNSPAATTALVQFDAELFDTGSNVDTTTNKGRFTAPVNGFYYFHANTSQSGSSTGAGILMICKNGIGTTPVGRGNDLRMASGYKGLVVECLLQLAAGDYVEVGLYTDTAVAMDVAAPANNAFSGFLVSET